MKYLLVVVALCATVALAGPAPWYKWASPEADYQVCAQFPPGDDWKVVKGPFQDARCQKPGVPH
jgi:hypothetical protein